MTQLVRAAFAALGTGPTRREIRLVAKAIRESGDAEALRLFEDAAVHMREGFAVLADLATECGSSSFIALDLLPQVFVDGWSPFPAGNPTKVAMDETVARLRAERASS